MSGKAEKIKSFTQGFAFRMIAGTVLWLLLFAVIFSVIGYIQFTDSLTREYNDSAFRTADSAAMLVEGDKIETFLATERGNTTEFHDPEYQDRWDRMNTLCQKQNVTLIYVIRVDTSDYGTIQSVFNTVNAGSGYTPWEVGYERPTTNEEYARVYRDIYENGLDRGTVVRTDGLRGREAHITSLIPIKNSQGDVVSILCVERPMDELVSGRQGYLNHIIIATVILTVVSAAMLALYLGRHFVKPMAKISREADRFAMETCSPQGRPLENISQIRELRSLATSVEKMEEDTLRYMQDLAQAAAEQERISVELSLASTIQENILPGTFPPYPNRKDFSIFASMDAAKEVGGDFYDFYLLDNDRLGFLVADVSGKGVPAALFMMRAKMTLKSLAESGLEVDEILTRANAGLCEGNMANMFVTAWLGIADLRTGTLTYANAGHNPPLIRHKDGSFSYLRTRSNLVLAGMEGVKYRKNTLTLAPGDALYLYTDGVTEAVDPQNNLFGEDRLLEALNVAPDQNDEERCRSVKRAIDAFADSAEQFDDITMLSVSFSFFRSYESIITPADSASTELVWDFIDRRTRSAELSPKVIHKAEIIVDEIYSNIHQYSGATRAQVHCTLDSERLELTFRDNGTPYDPLSAETPDISLSAEERQIGGLGIFMVKKLAASLKYVYEDGFNVLTVTLSL